MKAQMFEAFEHKGHRLIRLPKLKEEHQTAACLRCVRHDSREFTCTELPDCYGAYFKLVGTLTPEETAQFVIHKLEGNT